MSELPPVLPVPTEPLADIEEERKFLKLVMNDLLYVERQKPPLSVRAIIGGAVENKIPGWLTAPSLNLLIQTIDDEPFMQSLPPPHAVDSMNRTQLAALHIAAAARSHYLYNLTAFNALMLEAFAATVGTITPQLWKFPILSPENNAADDDRFTIPLVHALPDPKRAIQTVLDTFLSDKVRYRYTPRGVFRGLTKQLAGNLNEASGLSHDKEFYLDLDKRKHPKDSALSPENMVSTYLKGTPYYTFFLAPVPIQFPRKQRFDHTHIVGGSGAGKTTLIENLIMEDIKSADSPSLVIVDPHGDLIKKLTRGDLGIADRLIHINPRDIRFPPALNVFAMNEERLNGYDEATREQVTASVIQTFDYLFSGLLGADLTAKQGVFFRYIARLMLTLPQSMGRNATILDMLRLMSDDAPYADAIAKLPDIPREFFLSDFKSKTFQQTREQIRYRLQSIIENPTLARLFTSPETKIDLFTELNRGSIILVDTAKDFLKGGSSTFGRIFISLTLQAVLERAAIPEKNRKDTFLIVDEAASYFDGNIDDLLTDARKFKCGCVFAHQYLDQATGSLRSSLAANTGTKFVSGVSAGDARSMASEMRTTPDFIMDVPKLTFGTYLRGVTPHAVPVHVKFVNNVPELGISTHEAFIESNRTRTSFGAMNMNTAAPSAPTAASSTPSDEDFSKEW